MPSRNLAEGQGKDQKLGDSGFQSGTLGSYARPSLILEHAVTTATRVVGLNAPISASKKS